MSIARFRKSSAPPNTDPRDAIVELSELVLRSRRAARHIRELVRDRTVDIHHRGVYGWGQWLNEPYRIGDQWGRYGSSAGVQVLAMTHQEFGAGTWPEACRALRLAVDELFPDRVPPPPPAAPQMHEPTEDDPDPWKHHDFQQPLKVAFCVDALAPDVDEVVQGPAPALVEHLVSQRQKAEACWATRPPYDPHRPIHDLVVVTAFALLALRRFPEVQRRDEIREAYRWLANHADDELGVNVRALCGLALRGAVGIAGEDARVKAAIRSCDTSLRGWIDTNRQPILERPWFSPYVDGKNIDYVFLTPEIVVALFFLGGALDDTTEAYVRTVITHLTDNVNGPQVGQDPRGYRVQHALEGTVDQLWATRLLMAFVRWGDEQLGRARPDHLPTAVGGSFLRRTATTWNRRAVVVVALGVIVANGFVQGFVDSSGLIVGITTAVSAVASKFLGTALDPVIDRMLKKSR